MAHFQFFERFDSLRLDSYSIHMSPAAAEAVHHHHPSALRRSKSTSDPSLTPRRTATANIRTGNLTQSSSLFLSVTNMSRKKSNKTPTRSSSSSEANNCCLGADRFIPNRSTTDLEYAQHTLLINDNDDNEERRQKRWQFLEEEDFRDSSRILSFKTRASEPSSSSDSTSKVLYSSSKSKGGTNIRQISSKPFKVLDAPDLVDDFYLHLVDWSSLNHMAVILYTDVFIWNAFDGPIVELIGNSEEELTSVKWAKPGGSYYLALSDCNGVVQLWDTLRSKLLRNLGGHTDRVAVMDWNNHILSTGSRTGQIHLSDVRIQEHRINILRGHMQEVCGLCWSHDGKILASGGNDNLVQLWDIRSLTSPLFTLNQHQSAVKAVSWCPWQNNTLSTGGGSLDGTIRIWNSSTGNCLKSVDSGSQVSSVVWNAEYKELVSSHGFPNNQLTVWKYPSMTKLADLKGHTSRVLSLVLSPDGTTVASIGDETIRFWKVWTMKEQRTIVREHPILSIFQKIR